MNTENEKLSGAMFFKLIISMVMLFLIFKVFTENAEQPKVTKEDVETYLRNNS